MGLGDIVSGAANTVGDAASYIYHGAAGGENRADSRERHEGYDRAQREGNIARQEIYSDQQRLQQEVSAGTDPAAIRGRDNWDSWEHAAIKDMTDRLDSGQIHSAAQGWSSLGGKFANDVADFQQAMQQTIGAKWEGAAAQAARQSMSTYSQQAEGFGHAVELTGTKVSEAATGAEQTRAMVPPPKEFSIREAATTGILNPVAGGFNIYQQKQAQNAAHAEAVNVMNTVYTPVYVQSGEGVPTFAPPTATATPSADAAGGGGNGPVSGFPTQPPASGPPVGSGHNGGATFGGSGHWAPPPEANGPVNYGSASSATDVARAGHGGSVGGGHGMGAVAAGGTGSANSVAGGGGASDGSSPGLGGDSAVGDAPYGGQYAGPEGGGTGWQDAPYGGQHPDGDGGFGGVGASSFSPDPVMSPSNYGSPTSGYGTSGYGAGGTGYGAGNGLGAIGYGGVGGASGFGGAGFGPSGSGAPAGYGSGGGTAGSGGPMGRGATSGVGSSPAAAEAAAARRVGGSAASGGRGGAGMGGMGAGRGRGEDDIEHNTPSYLITQDHGSEVVGELPRVAPPVIGE